MTGPSRIKAAGGPLLFGKCDGHQVPNRRLPAAAAAASRLAVLLWGLQVTSGAAYYAKSPSEAAQVETAVPPPGAAPDRNGTILAQDQVTWSAVLAGGREDQVGPPLENPLCQEGDVAWEGTAPLPGLPPPAPGRRAGRGELHPCVSSGWAGAPLPPHAPGPGGTDEP